MTAALANVTPASSTICFIGDCAASPPPPVKLTLAPGQAATVDYAPVLAAGSRQQLRPAFSFANVLACARLAGTVELFDSASARTTILYPPQPILAVLGAAGITTADTIRLNVVYPPTPFAPANPCSVQASLLPLNSTVGLSTRRAGAEHVRAPARPIRGARILEPRSGRRHAPDGAARREAA